MKLIGQNLQLSSIVKITGQKIKWENKNPEDLTHSISKNRNYLDISKKYAGSIF